MSDKPDLPQREDKRTLAEHERFLLYGEPKTGKTFCAHTAPDPIYTLVLGDSSELDTLHGKDFKDKYPGKVIYSDHIQEERGKHGIFKRAEAYDKACTRMDEVIALRKAGDLDFETLVIDNATVLLEYEMNKAFELGASGGEGNPSAGLRKLREHNIYVPADYDYKSQMSLTSQFVGWLTDLPFHIVLVAHEYKNFEESEKRGKRNLVSVLPLFTGRNRTRMPGKFSNVWRFTSEGSDKARIFYAQTSGSSNPEVIAGTRLGGVLPFKWRDPNLTKAIKKFKRQES